MKRRLSLGRAKKDPFFAWRLSYGSFVSRTWKYLYMEAPKSGCTSTKAHVSDLEQLPRHAPWPESVHERLPDGMLSLSDLDEDEADYFLTHRDVCRFYVYRDPVRRLISAFKDKILSDDEAVASHPPFAAAVSEMMLAHRLASREQIRLAHFIRYVSSQSDTDREAHWMSQRRLILADYIDYNFVVDLADYEAGMRGLFERLGVPRIHEFDFSVRHHAGGERIVDASPDEERAIRHVYRDDHLLAPPGRRVA